MNITLFILLFLYSYHFSQTFIIYLLIFTGLLACVSSVVSFPYDQQVPMNLATDLFQNHYFTHFVVIVRIKIHNFTQLPAAYEASIGYVSMR